MRALFIFTLFALALSSCTLVKNQQSSNFNRVKYHAHLKKNKKEKKAFVNTVKSFDKDEKKLENETPTTTIKTKRELLANNPTPSKVKAETRTYAKVVKPIVAERLSSILNDATQLKIEKKKKALLTHDWWDEDPEDWPWGEIVLAVIAILVIAILIVILIDLIGAIVGSLLGLIFLLALAYFLYEYWI